MAEIARELGAPRLRRSTILRWVVRYPKEFANRWLQFEQRVGRSWRADDTYVKVGRQRMFLYRAVDQRGRTVESYLSRTVVSVSNGSLPRKIMAQLSYVFKYLDTSSEVRLRSAPP